MSEAVYRGCIFCKSGRERDVVQSFELLIPAGRAIFPTRTRYRRRGESVSEDQVALLPGYVFFQLPRSDGDEEFELRDISRIDSVLRLLRYADGDWRLTGFDDQFAEMMFKAGGNIGVSRAYFDKGKKIRILSGFLKDYEGSIVRVNKKTRTVEVLVDFRGKKVSMWLGYELVEPVSEPVR